MFIVFIILTLSSIVAGSSVTYQVQQTISTANMEEISSSAQALSDLSEEMQFSLGKFIV